MNMVVNRMSNFNSSTTKIYIMLVKNNLYINPHHARHHPRCLVLRGERGVVAQTSAAAAAGGRSMGRRAATSTGARRASYSPPPTHRRH